MTFFLHMAAQSIRRRLGRFKITLAAIALSAAAIVLLQGILNGVGEAMVRNAVSIQSGHVQADWPAAQMSNDSLIASCESIPGVRQALMRSRSIGLMTGQKDCRALATLYGVDPLREGRRTIIARKIIAGRYLAQDGEIVIGETMAGMLKAKVGSVATFRPSVTSERQYRVCGIFRTTLPEMDRLMAYTGDQEPADSQEVSLFLDRAESAPAVADSLKGIAPAGARVRDWKQIMPDLAQLLILDRKAGNIVVALVLAVLALGISNTLFITVHERTREFGILKAMGMTPHGIMLLVLAETAMLTGLGSLAGAGIGVLAAEAFCWRGGMDLSLWTNMNPLFVDSGVIWPRVTAAAVAMPAGVVVVCGLLAGLLPARWAGRITVMEALRTL